MCVCVCARVCVYVCVRACMETSEHVLYEEQVKGMYVRMHVDILLLHEYIKFFKISHSQYHESLAVGYFCYTAKL